MKDLVSEGFANVVKPYIDNEIATRAKLGAHNILKFPNELSDNGYAYSGNTGTVTAYGECGFKLNGTFPTAVAVFITPRETTNVKYLFYIKKGSYRIKLFDSNFINQTFGSLTVGARVYTTYNGESNRVASSNVSEKALEFTIDENTPCDYITSDGRYLIGIALMPSVTTYNNLVVYPLLELASDNNTSYQPYVMTNRELTEVAQQVEGGYIIKTDKTNSLVSVTADGVKTFGTLLSELRTALLTYMSNHPDEYCEILGADTGAGLLGNNLNSTALGKLYHSGDAPRLRFYGFAFADDATTIRVIDVSASSVSYKRYSISQSQYTASDSTDSIASSGTGLALHIRIYTKVS